MGSLDTISGIGKSSLDLLEAVGIGTTEELASHDAETLAQELDRANALLRINKRAPGEAMVGKWIANAREQRDVIPTPSSQPEPELHEPLNHEANPEVAEMLSRAPFAIPLPGRIIMEEGLAVADIAAGLLLNRYSGELEVRVDSPPVGGAKISAPRPAGNLGTIGMRDGRRHFEASSANRIHPSPVNGRKMPKSRPSGKDDRVSLIRAPHEQTNAGKDPASRNFVRGVLHIHPWKLRLGAAFSLLLIVDLPLSIIAAMLLLLSREYPGTFAWVPEWFLAFPAVLPLAALGALFWAYPGKCRICSQRLFVPTRAFKHIKAHRIPGLGYILSLSLHLLLYSWFRCSSCGTPVRLKK